MPVEGIMRSVYFPHNLAKELAQFILELNAALANYTIEHDQGGWYVTVK